MVKPSVILKMKFIKCLATLIQFIILYVCQLFSVTISHSFFVLVVVFGGFILALIASTFALSIFVLAVTGACTAFHFS
jgi:hypothetical protein